MIGLRFLRASMMMPSPATRERFGTSAVQRDIIVISSARTISLNARRHLCG